MNMKIVILVAITLVIMGISPSFASQKYLNSLNEVYGNGSCATCHLNGTSDGPRTSYGTMFENKPNHSANASTALLAIGAPPTSTLNTTTPKATVVTPAPTPVTTAAATPVTTAAATPVPPATAGATPASPGFGIGLALIGLFAWSLLAKRKNN